MWRQRFDVCDWSWPVVRLTPRRLTAPTQRQAGHPPVTLLPEQRGSTAATQRRRGDTPTSTVPGTAVGSAVQTLPAPPAPLIDVLPGMPPVADPHNIYSEAGANMLRPVAEQSKAYAYVPNTKSGDVWVIDQRTFQVVDKFPVGKEVQHVVDFSAVDPKYLRGEPPPGARPAGSGTPTFAAGP